MARSLARHFRTSKKGKMFAAGKGTPKLRTVINAQYLNTAHSRKVGLPLGRAVKQKFALQLRRAGVHFIVPRAGLFGRTGGRATDPARFAVSADLAKGFTARNLYVNTWRSKGDVFRTVRRELRKVPAPAKSAALLKATMRYWSKKG